MRALTVAAWTNPNNYFRHAVRLFNGEDLMLAAGGRLSATLGITPCNGEHALHLGQLQHNRHRCHSA